MARVFTTSAQRDRLDKVNPNELADLIREIAGDSKFGALFEQILGAIPEVTAEQTGDGTEQDITNNVGKVPTVVIPIITELPDDGYGTVAPVDFAAGTHTAALYKMTATTGVKYRLLAFFHAN